MTRFVMVVVLALLLMGRPGLARDSDEPPSYKDKPLPELAVKTGKWFNADKPPTLAALKGRLVLVVLTTLW